MKLFLSYVNSATVSLAFLSGNTGSQFRWWTLQLCCSLGRQRLQWLKNTARNIHQVVYSSPPPFPVPNQIRLVQQTSNGKKRSVLKYSQDYNRKHESPFKKKKISKITVFRWVCKSKSTNSWYTGSSCNQAMQRVSSSLTQIIHLSYRCLFSGIPPRQRFTKGKYPVYVSNYIYHIKPAGTAGRQKRLHSTLISKGIELTF